MDILSEKSIVMDIDMDIISDKPEPAGGNNKSSTSYSYSHTSKRVVAPKRCEENMDIRNNNRSTERQIHKKR